MVKMVKRKKRGAPKGNQNARTHGLYSKALSEAEKLELADIADITGIDDEIILLRIKLRQLVESHPDRLDLHIYAATAIARLVKIKYQISKEQKHSLKEAITRVLTEVAAPLGVGIGMGVGARLK